MKLKHLFTLIAIASCTLLGFTACDDEDYAPITLTNASGSDVNINNNTLVMDAFSKGEVFYIIGGNGRYTIQNNNEEIVTYQYNGETITFVPVGVGEATVIISDHAGNKLTLNIEVMNHFVSYKVTGVSATADGNEMLVGEVKELIKRITDESLVKEGGSFDFKYTNQEQTLGSVTIYPKASGRPLSGIFREEERTVDNKTFKEMTITMADHKIHVLTLVNYNNTDMKDMMLVEDVTEMYKGAYPKLEKAVLTYKVSY